MSQNVMCLLRQWQIDIYRHVQQQINSLLHKPIVNLLIQHVHLTTMNCCDGSFLISTMAANLLYDILCMMHSKVWLSHTSFVQLQDMHMVTKYAKLAFGNTALQSCHLLWYWKSCDNPLKWTNLTFLFCFSFYTK